MARHQIMENESRVFWIRSVISMEKSKSFWINIPYEYASKMKIQKGQKLELQMDKQGNLIVMRQVENVQ